MKIIKQKCGLKWKVLMYIQLESPTEERKKKNILRNNGIEFSSTDYRPWLMGLETFVNLKPIKNTDIFLHMIAKLLKAIKKRESLKTTKGKKYITFKGTKIKLISSSSTKTVKEKTLRRPLGRIGNTKILHF